MASIFEKEPIFSHERPWNDTTKLPEKYKFSGRAGKAEVHLDSGSLGMEFFYEKTLLYPAVCMRRPSRAVMHTTDVLHADAVQRHNRPSGDQLA